jgi:hypothetical protein
MRVGARFTESALRGRPGRRRCSRQRPIVAEPAVRVEHAEAVSDAGHRASPRPTISASNSASTGPCAPLTGGPAAASISAAIATTWPIQPISGPTSMVGWPVGGTGWRERAWASPASTPTQCSFVAASSGSTGLIQPRTRRTEQSGYPTIGWQSNGLACGKRSPSPRPTTASWTSRDGVPARASPQPAATTSTCTSG